MKSISNKTKVKLNKKSKISKKQTKRKNKKSLKSVKRIQKGGVGNEEVFGIIRDKTGRDFKSEFPACLRLIREFSQSPEQLQPRVKMDGTPLQQVDFWTYEAKMKPTPDFEVIFEDPLEWYQRKNPEFKILKRPTEEEIPRLPFNYTPDMYIGDENQVKVPEYRFLVAQMIKDLLLILYFGKMPPLRKNNTLDKKSIQLAQLNFINKTEESKIELFKKEISNILTEIDQNIAKGFKYVEFIYCISNYLNLFSSIDFNSKNPDENECVYNIIFFKKLLLTPFIIFPTIIQINFKKTINLICAPLLNFRLSNSRKKIHKFYNNPCSEILHDIQVHCAKTHGIYSFIGKVFTNKEEYIKSQINRPTLERMTLEIINLKKTYDMYNDFFEKIKNLFNYENEKEQKYINTIFLFFIFHETHGIYIISFEDLIDHLKKDKIKILTSIKKELNITSILIKSFNGTEKETPLTDLYDQFISDLKTALTSQSSSAAATASSATASA